MPNAGPMDLKRFWDLINWARARAPEDPQGALFREFLRLPPEDLLGFWLQFRERVGLAYREDLWSVADLLNGGTSDDGFFYFRCWLVDQGSRVYNDALADPDSLAGAEGLSDHNESNGFWDAASAAWVERTRRGREEFDRDIRLVPWEHPDCRPAGWDVEDPDEFRRRFPRLSAIYY